MKLTTLAQLGLSTPAGLDPNRYASEHEAKYLHQRLVDDDAEHQLLVNRVARANEAFASADSDFSSIEQQYYALKHVREAASNYREEAQARLKAHKTLLASQRALLHPVRKMPTELLIAIFEYCCPLSDPGLDDYGDDNRLNTNDTAAPFNLAFVCRRWRNACIGNQTLWAVVDIDFGRIHKRRRLERHVTYVETLFSRSGSAMITIRLVNINNPNMADVKPLRTALFRCMNRCQSLGLHADLNPLLQRNRFTSLLEIRTPQLRSLSLSGSFFDFPPDRFGEPLLKHAPLLQTIRTRGDSNFTIRLAAQPSVTEYIHHNAAFSDPDDMYLALKACPNLKTLTVELIGAVLELEDDLPHTAVALRKLTIHTHGVDVSDSEVTRRFCRKYQLPVLGSLRLDGDISQGDHRLLVLSEWKATLQQLTFLSVALDSSHIGQFVALLPSFPELDTLELVETIFTPHALKTFSKALGEALPLGEWLCPLLDAVYLATCEFHDGCDMSDIVNAIRLRVSAAKVDEDDNRPAMLREFDISKDYDVSSTINEFIEEQNRDDATSNAGDEEDPGNVGSQPA